MKFLGGKKLLDEQDAYGGVAFGRQVTQNNTRDGYIDDGNIAWPERVVEARRQWPEASAGDFEKVGKRLYRDRASGIEYRRANGCPLLQIGTDANRGISAFFVENGELVFLERADFDGTTRVYHGEVTSQEFKAVAGGGGIQ